MRGRERFNSPRISQHERERQDFILGYNLVVGWLNFRFLRGEERREREMGRRKSNIEEQGRGRRGRTNFRSRLETMLLLGEEGVSDVFECGGAKMRMEMEKIELR